jgi:hypothetical protein
MNDDLEAHRRQDAHSQRAALIGLAICLALVLGGLLLVYALKKTSALQDCRGAPTARPWRAMTRAMPAPQWGAGPRTT